MKKKIVYLFFCLLLLCTAACGKKDGNEPVPTPTLLPTSTPTPTPVPENLAVTQLNALHETFTAIFDKVSVNMPDTKHGIGYDADMKISINPEVAELFELTGLETIGMFMSCDIKDSIAANAALSLNGSDILDFELFTDFAGFYINLPKYSAQYAGQAVGAEQGAFGIPDYNAIFQLSRSFIDRLFGCFNAADGIRTASIGSGDYSVTGEKHTLSADLAELSAILNEFAEEMKQFPYFNIMFEDMDTEEISGTVYLHYYAGENGTFAWELSPYLEPSEDQKENFVFVKSEKGVCLYATEYDGSISVLFRTEAADDNTGTLLLPDEAGDIVLNYEVSKNHFALSGSSEEANLMIEVTSDGTSAECSLSVDTPEGMSVTVLYSVNEAGIQMSAGLTYFGIEFGTLTADSTYREYREVSAPASFVTPEEWTAGLDQEALFMDMAGLMIQYPFLANLFSDSETEELPQ